MTEIFVEKVNANISRKQFTQSNYLQGGAGKNESGGGKAGHWTCLDHIPSDTF